MREVLVMSILQRGKVKVTQALCPEPPTAQGVEARSECTIPRVPSFTEDLGPAY